MLITFIWGNAIIILRDISSNQDAWFASLLSGAMAVPVYFIYSRIIKLFPQKAFGDILKTVFGKVLGVIILALFVFYAFFVAANILRQLTEYIQITALPETPQYAFAICITLVCVYMLKLGIEVMGRWSMFILPVIVFIFLMAFLLSTYLMDFNHFKPVLHNSFQVIANNAYSYFTIPYGEAVVFLFLCDSLKEPAKTFKIFFVSLAAGTGVITLAIIRNIAALGVENIKYLTFPSFNAVRLIQIGSFIERIELIISVILTLCGFFKLCACLLAASKGMAHILHLNSNRATIAPLALLMLLLSPILFKSVMEMFDFSMVYSYFCFPFQVFLPLIIWITAEIKHKQNKKSKGVPT